MTITCAPLNTDLERPKLILPSSVQNQNRVLSMLKQEQDPAIGQCQHTLHNLHKKSMRTQMHRTWFPSRMASSTSVLFKSTQEATMANKYACLPSKRARLASFSSFSLCYRKETKMLCGNCCSKMDSFCNNFIQSLLFQVLVFRKQVACFNDTSFMYYLLFLEIMLFLS